MKTTTKLFRVTLKGYLGIYGTSYVVAQDPTSAYNIVRNHIDDKNYGFVDLRELEKIELIAEDYEYTHTGSKLFIDKAGE